MREWLVTNGLGGYASLTHQNRTTRKFHGLLISSINPPTERWVFVSNVWDRIHVGDIVYDLNEVKGVFDFDLFPSFSYDLGELKVKKTIFMEHGKNTTIIKYEVETDKQVSLIHSPELNSRHFYDLTEQNSVVFQQDIFQHGVSIQPSNIDKKLKIVLRDSSYQPAERWITSQYESDHERNDSWIDHNLQIGDFSKTIKGSSEYYLIFTLESDIDSNPSNIYSKEFQRKKRLLEQANLGSKFHKLVLSTDHFIVKKENGKSIAAGYHWFGDWGRDTLISLPGITLVTKRFDDAKQILFSLSKYCKNGLIPNAFMDRDSQAVYNTVDASLWFVDRVYQYLKYTNDQDFLKKIWNTLQSIIDGYKNGTDYGIHMDNDFLISHGPGLTWMDVKIGDYYPTPREKKAVEIQALWYNALRIMNLLSEIIGKEDENYSNLANTVKDNFNVQFDQQYDVIDTRDLSFRPNQIFLVSLDFSMIDYNMQKTIVESIEEKLVTVFGLRTLSSDDSRYKGSYIGNFNRDLAYHNGTVWPWLMGPFLKAFVKINKNQKTRREYAYQHFLQPMFGVMGKTWDGSIPEICDADPPYSPRGCIAQAWSVAEILRSWVEDIEGSAPKYEQLFLSHEIRV